jgi:hypothetical protein
MPTGADVPSRVQGGNPVGEEAIMSNDLAVGDHVRWNSEAGEVTGVIVKKHVRDTEYKGHMRRCTREDPQYEIKSDKTDHVAMHKGDVLYRIG